MSTVLLEKHDNFAVVTLNRPECNERSIAGTA